MKKGSYFDFISEKHKKMCKTLNYFEHFLILISAVGGIASISAFARLIGIPAGITSSAWGLSLQELKSINQLTRKKTENCPREILVIDSVLKTNSRMYKIKYLNRENIIGSFYKKWTAVE